VILNREDYIKNIKWTSPHLRLHSTSNEWCLYQNLRN
jgi:hypothetical protein